jgi:hypothetical protein
MLEERGTLGRMLSGLTRTKEQRVQDRKLSEAVLVEAERVQQAVLLEKSEEAHLVIAVRYQTAKDELRIAHREAMSELSQLAEDQLERSLNTMFCIKKRQLDKLAGIEGDPELIAEAQRCIAELTMTSANELIQRNSKVE